jgi:hypothetical protein
MPRFFTCHWRNSGWRNEVNSEYKPVSSAGSNNFRKRGVINGAVVYIITIIDGQLYLGGKMNVEKIVPRNVAVRIIGKSSLWDAKEWIIDETRSGTPLNFHRKLSPEISKQLQFGPVGMEPKGLVFTSTTNLDNQTTRGVRELTPKSAALLDKILKVTDSFPRSDEVLTVTTEILEGSVTIPVIENSPAKIKNYSGAGFGNSVENELVEKSAIDFVRNWYELEGWDVESVERDRCGFDLNCREDGSEEHVEVKGVSNSKQTFVITAGEVKKAESDPKFRVCVVTNARTENKSMFQYSGKEFLAAFALKPIQYFAELKSGKR